MALVKIELVKGRYMNLVLPSGTYTLRAGGFAMIPEEEVKLLQKAIDAGIIVVKKEEEAPKEKAEEEQSTAPAEEEISLADAEEAGPQPEEMPKEEPGEQGKEEPEKEPEKPKQKKRGRKKKGGK